MFQIFSPGEIQDESVDRERSHAPGTEHNDSRMTSGGELSHVREIEIQSENH